MARTVTDRPEFGKVYSLTGLGNSIANGNTWAESLVTTCDYCKESLGEDAGSSVCKKCLSDPQRRANRG